MALPLLTSPEDIRGIVKFLARKPAGAVLENVEAILGAEFVEPRKLATYQRLGLVARENDQIRLTPDIGRDLARANDAEFASQLRERLGSIAAYEACLEWAYEQKLDQLTSSDVGAFWHDHHPDELGTNNERQITERATCFLKLAEGAALGTYVVGRKGQPTRLDLDRDALEAFVKSREFRVPEREESAAPDESIGRSYDNAANGAPAATSSDSSSNSNGQAQPSVPIQGQAIFVGYGKNKKPLDQLKGILAEFKIPYKVVTEEPNLGRPISDKVAETMKQCNCAILIFTADEEFFDKDGSSVWRPSENVVHELGASSFLYGKRIVVLKEEVVQLPTNFRDIGYIPFERDALAAKAMEVLKELIGFGIVKVTT